MKDNMFGPKKIVGAKQIASAGLTLGVGMLVLPFIPFKEAARYKPFRKKKNG